MEHAVRLKKKTLSLSLSLCLYIYIYIYMYYCSVLNVADLAETLYILMTTFCLLYICSVTCIQSHVIDGVYFLSK